MELWAVDGSMIDKDSYILLYTVIYGSGIARNL